MQTNCSSCAGSFEISSEEITFIKKISPEIGGRKYEIPLPTLCPNCRLAERTSHRNEQNFYHNVSSKSGTPVISLYSPDTEWGKKLKIYTHEEWWSDSWDGLDYGREFNFNRGFFEQFHELILQIPYVNLIQVGNENSPYTTGTGYCKNCYLINCSENCQDCYYGKLLQGCTDVMDSSYAYDSELLYECFNVKKCYSCNFISYSQNCTDCWFSENLKGCKNCFLCTNLSNKEYYLMNKPVSKEEYEAGVKAFLGSHSYVQKAKEILAQLRQDRIYKYANIINSENSTGDFLTNCKNCTDSYDVNDSQDCKYVTVGVNIKDVVDCSNMYLKPELCYQVLGTIGVYNTIFSLYVFNSQNVMYSQFCHNSKNLFGCSGLRNKEYCILNKQYSKEDYEKIVPQIIEAMQKTGEWGRYFPMSLSPFAYNETVAQEYVPLTKEEALAKGYRWKDADQKEYKPQTYILPDNIKEVPDTIINEVLACEACGKNYRIIVQELKRLKTAGLPIPRKCPDCRHADRMKLRNPRKIWTRKCDKCSTSMQTTFTPEDPRKIYCESCYLATVL